jgi:hypothetical protein
MSGPPPRQPCGTLAAVRRHYRRGEPVCADCRQAERLAHRKDMRPPLGADWRPVRNGLPEFVPYVYRGTGEDQLTPWM